MRILIIEPDEYYHSQFRDHIGQLAELEFSRSGESPLRMIEAGSFDLIIMELLLQDGHAYDLLPKIRNIPVVIYTKVSHVEDVQQCLNLGVNAYFVKGQDTINDIKKIVLAYNPELLTTNY